MPLYNLDQITDEQIVRATAVEIITYLADLEGMIKLCKLSFSDKTQKYIDIKWNICKIRGIELKKDLKGS